MTRSLGLRLLGLWLVGTALTAALGLLFAFAIIGAFADAQVIVNMLLGAYVQVAVVAAALVALIVRGTPRAGGPVHWVDQVLYGIGVVVIGQVGWGFTIEQLGDGLDFWGAVVFGGLAFVVTAGLFALPSAIGAIRGRSAG